MAGLLPEAKLYATPNEVTKAWMEWSKTRVCARCGQTFTWLSSFGKWECKQHLGPLTYKTKTNKRGIKNRVYKYYNCCQRRPNTAVRQFNENIWATVRCTRPCVDRFPTENPVDGCIPCDHTEAVHILDDGIRLSIPIESTTNEHAFGPEGGHKINDIILYNGKERAIAQVYFDKTVDLQDVDNGRIPSRFLVWPNVENKLIIGKIFDYSTQKETVPVKIINKYLKNYKTVVDIKIMDLGMPVHSIAAMIPHMGPNPESRPGWQFERDEDGKVIYPHIRNVADRTKYIKKDIDI